jgi:hypothetical protein
VPEVLLLSHVNYMTLDNITLQRFTEKILNKENGCWLFTSCVGKNGYARFKLNKRLRLAHRVSYEHFVGGIPDGFHLHHTCECKACVNPRHLNPVSPRQHIVHLSPKAPAYKHHRQTHCQRGHFLSTENIYWSRSRRNRSCKICKHEDWLKRAKIRGSRSMPSLADILVMRDLLDWGVSPKVVGALYNRSQGLISNIKTRKTWPNACVDDLLTESR